MLLPERCMVFHFAVEDPVLAPHALVECSLPFWPDRSVEEILLQGVDVAA